MGWSFRKSFRLLPGIRINLSKSGPRLSFGVPGARASINMQGKARVYAAKGPIRFQKSVTLGSPAPLIEKTSTGLLSYLKRLITDRR
jgi:hypothetical protein